MAQREDPTRVRVLRVLLFGQAAVLSAAALLTGLLDLTGEQTVSADPVRLTGMTAALGVALVLAFAGSSAAGRRRLAGFSSLVSALLCLLVGAWPLAGAGAAAAAVAFVPARGRHV